MAYTDFIAVIDLGTFQLKGMVGVKTASGGLTILAHEAEESGTAIRRGCVFNVDETATRVKKLVRKLEAKLNGARIAKVYAGIGGQSLHSIDHSVVHELPEEGVVTDEIIDILFEECRVYKPELLEVLHIVSPTYYVDGVLEPNPVGVPCKEIEARFKLIVGRPSLRRHVEISMGDKAKLEVAGIRISPLALADSVLTENEKELGCALIDFGAGVTSLSVYKNGKLQNLCVIPLGGQLITRDLTSLHLVETEAEKIKINYGGAVADSENDETIQVNAMDGVGIREVKLAEVDYVVESRMKEILENVYAQLELSDPAKNLGGGVIITGGASRLRGVSDVIKKKLKVNVRHATIRKGIVENQNLIESSDAIAIGLLMQGTENCALVTVTSTSAEPIRGAKEGNLFGDDEGMSPEEKERLEREKKEKKEQERIERERREREKKEKKRKFSDFFNKGIDKIGNLFDEDDMR